MIKKKVQNAANNSGQARLNRNKVIDFNESNKLLHDIGHSKITYEEALKRTENVRNDINKIISMSLNQNQIIVLNIIFMVNHFFTGEIESVGLNNKDNFEVFKEKSDAEKQESDEQQDTTDIPKLESEESAAERRNQDGQGLKKIIPDQMLSRLPITLAQLKAGNNSQKLINEIRQLLYSLYRSKKLTKTIYNHLINAI